MSTIKKCIVVLSGGQDSTTCAFWAKQNYEELHCVTFDYNQKHSREIEAAKKVAELVGAASHEVIQVGPILHGRSPLTNPEESLEQYTDFASMDKIIGDRVEKTFVPMRNALFLVLAANRGACVDANHLVTGVCQADNANYPDCRESFVIAMDEAIGQALGTDFVIQAPLLFKSKAESIHQAMQMPGCYKALGYSHTAYDGAYPPSGHDHATILRAHGFEEAGVPDPLVVRAHVECSDFPLPDTANYDVARVLLQEIAADVAANGEGATPTFDQTLDLLVQKVGAK